MDLISQTRLAAWSATMRARLTLPLRIELWTGQHIDFSHETPRVTIRIPAPGALRHLFTPSLYNLGSAYVEGNIEVSGCASDMIAVVNALAASSLKREGKFARIVRAARHTRHSDAQAVRFHYDVSNAFYAQWLDPQLVYSCAYFEHGDEDLESAQQAKIAHILTKLRLTRGQRLLDIGCGWGALVLQAARDYDAQCVGITLSENQATLARERVARAGLAQRIEIRLQDYRDVRGQFDRIASVGMVEHVGRRNLADYFARIDALLAPDGLALNHGITSTDPNDGETPYGGGEFIERYVFPQGELAHLSTLLKALQQGGLEVLDVENLRRHYARTCALWTSNFEAHAEQIKALTDARCFRIWHIYLAGCSYAFAHDWISVHQILCAKAGRAPELLPWSRRFMYPPLCRANADAA